MVYRGRVEHSSVTEHEPSMHTALVSVPAPEKEKQIYMHI
jgi:hypothetical protein